MLKTDYLPQGSIVLPPFDHESSLNFSKNSPLRSPPSLVVASTNGLLRSSGKFLSRREPHPLLVRLAWLKPGCRGWHDGQAQGSR